MQIPAFIILIVYGVIIFIFSLLAFFNIYHAVRFGIFDAPVKAVTFIFILISCGIFVITGLFLMTSNWQEAYFSLDIPNFSDTSSKIPR